MLSSGSDSSPEFEAIMELVKYNLFQCNKVCVENNSYDDYAERVEILNSVSEDLYNKFIKFILDMAEMLKEILYSLPMTELITT